MKVFNAFFLQSGCKLVLRKALLAGDGNRSNVGNALYAYNLERFNEAVNISAFVPNGVNN